MKIESMFNRNKVVFSLEVFPPKKDGSIDTLYQMLDEVCAIKPEYISVTYGAGGNKADTKTRDIAASIKSKYNIEPLAHLTCVNCTKEDVDYIVADYINHGIENIMALRGDINPDIPPKKDFRYASDMTAYIKASYDIGVSGACYPEVHFEAKSAEEDIENLKKKVDAGAQSLITQLFFDNDVFYDFRDRAAKAGISVPISAGIMPVTSKSQIERMVTMCGASLPHKFVRMIQHFENNPEGLREAGISYAINQITELISDGIEGIHLYTMNNAYVAKKISESVKGML